MQQPSRIRLGLLLLVVLISLVAVDWFQQRREMESLLTAEEASTSAIEAFKGDVRAATEGQQKTTTGQFVNADAIRREISDAADAAASQVLTTGDMVADVRLLPWHRALARAKARYLAHSAEWQRYYEAGAKDYDALTAPTPRIRGTNATAKRAMLDALPWFTGNGVRDRVNSVFD